MRILGIDYGRKRLGLSLSDEGKMLASPLTVRPRTSLAQDLSFLRKLVYDNKVGKIVIGMPFNMDGSEGQMSTEARRFASKLSEYCDIKVVFFDERMTTREAERVLVQADLSRKRRRHLRDGVAAVLILQGYLDLQGSIANRNKEASNNQQ
jgi:putative holliday junction resolvase